MQNNQEQQILNEDLKNKRLFFAGAIAFIIIAIAIIGVYIFIKITGPGQDAGEGDDIPPAVFFYNRDQLLNKLDKYPGDEVSSHIETVVLNDNEVKSAPKDNESPTDRYITYVTTINPIQKQSLESDYLFTFTVSISDGREYQVTTIEDGSFGRFYIGTIIKRTDKYTNDFVFYDYNEDELYFGEEFNYKEYLNNWVNSQYVKNPVYDTSNLLKDDK